MTLKAPFPYFGGKSTVTPEIWKRFGNTPNFIDPFFGSGAVLLGRPIEHFRDRIPTETVNDINGYIVNFWRAVRADPEQVAKLANIPTYESHLHAVHIWLLNKRSELSAKLEGNPDYYDPEIAARWVWGQCTWLGSGWCAGDGPWISLDGQLVNSNTLETAPDDSGVDRQLPQLRNSGQGVSRKRPNLINEGRGISRALPELRGSGNGSTVNRGVRRIIPDIALGSGGINKPSIQGHEAALVQWMTDLADRFSRVRVCCGDWQRVLRPAVTFSHGVTAVILDPPYPHVEREKVYADEHATIAYEVRAWAIANGNNPLFRIAYCGYDDGYQFPADWQVYRWKANGGMSNNGNKGSRGKVNKHRETIWFSPHCVNPNTLAGLPMFDALYI